MTASGAVVPVSLRWTEVDEARTISVVLARHRKSWLIDDIRSPTSPDRPSLREELRQILTDYHGRRSKPAPG